MKIAKIYKNLIIKNNHQISLITDNSKKIVPNSVFVAIKGYNHNGENYIEEAINTGALSIITEKEVDDNKYPNINFIKVTDAKKELANLLKLFYYKKLKKFKFIGITGTNGKTTTCTLLYRYLRSLNLNTICFTSINNYINDLVKATINTTPNIVTIYETIIQSNLKSGYVIIEISSQAISELRVLGLDFDVISITNISSDHLDYHHNLTDYFYTKARLLFQLKKDGCVVLNKDEQHFSKLQSFITNPVYSFGEKNSCDFRFEIIDLKMNDSLFILTNHEDIIAFETPLTGKFNVQNITNVFAILKVLKISTELFPNFIKSILPIDGRMNYYEINNRLIIIDYAHTVEAVKTTLKTIKEISDRNIRLVIGCGGNRDRLKRPIIGQLACLYANFVYFTEDNSRNEKLSNILKEITCDLTTNNYMVIESRMKAIKKAVIDSKENDIIILMGKGKEETIINNHALTDLDMIKSCFQELNNE